MQKVIDDERSYTHPFDPLRESESSAGSTYTIIHNGKRVEVPESIKTVGQLKEFLGVPEDYTVTEYTGNSTSKLLTDNFSTEKLKGVKIATNPQVISG
ncbi:MAG TPA: hypothetical protein VNM22_15735 [Candidatus Limnocylindrales bacterium]|nr:hypothetical protein [Candidatus Limnocylindrales bacterium]